MGSLVTQRKGSLHGGVNNQDAAFRLEHQVEEMINCVPTVDRGVLLRNASFPIKLQTPSGVITEATFPADEDSIFSYEYDRGVVNGRKSELVFIITRTGGLEIVDLTLTEAEDDDGNSILAGTLYTKHEGITYEDSSAENYILSNFSKDNYAMTAVKDTVFISNNSVAPMMSSSTGIPDDDGNFGINYKRMGYIWIKKIDPVYGWRYAASLKIKKSDGSIIDINTAYTNPIKEDTSLATAELANAINTALGTLGIASATGSVMMILLLDSSNELLSVDAKDTYGNSASFGWSHKVDYPTDLPKSMGVLTPIVEVGEFNKPSYWLQYKHGTWVETRKPLIVTTINPKSMPYRIIRSISGTKYHFTVKTYEWGYRTVGDEKTNKLPSFIGQPIIDLLFFKNRFAFITSNTISLSEVGEYGNFFRTTVGTQLDSDRIDAGIEGLNAINIKHAIALSNSIIMFSKNSQFRFKGGEILSPSSYEMRHELSYDVNVNVRPLFMNDRVFFIAKRGDNSAVYELQISNNANINSHASDISAHCQAYIDSDIEKLTGSPTNSMLFLTSARDYRKKPTDAHKANTIFVFKYYDNGNDRLQSAWFKWTLNGNILSGFAIGGNLYTMLNRENLLSRFEWVIGSGQWEMDKKWHMDYPWIMSPDNLKRQRQFERIAIFPNDREDWHLDNYFTPIDGYIAFGEWVYGKDGNRDFRGSVLMRTVEMRGEGEFDVWVEDTHRNKKRVIPNKNISRGKMMVYGNSCNIRVGIRNVGIAGFRLDGVSFEGTLNRRQINKG